MDSKQFGFFGEGIALKYLRDKGYQILDKNYSPSRKIAGRGPKRGEIDIVTKKDDIISFVEVKTLNKTSGEPFSAISPEEKVDYLKRKKLIKMAKLWLMEKKIPLETKWQIDVIAIKADFNNKLAKIRHFQNAIY